MSYRTFKRAFGETNLERKCRLLFGVCLGVLIFGAFLWVDNIGEKLIKKNTEQIGRDWVKMSIFHLHWMVWETDEKRRPLLQDMTSELLPENYQWTLLSLGADEVPWQYVSDARGPENAEERQLLTQLKEKWKEQLPTEGSIEPTVKTLPFPSQGKHCFYQPIYWGKSCKYCHGPIVGIVPASEVGVAENLAAPFRVMKLIIPYKETRDAVNSTRAALIAAAILTVFVAMVMLYVIVRYVIVKPLKHLRDVSEEISRGNSDLRAEIHTNDEFEELADAFNRMLQHLIEAHSELRNVNVNLDTKVNELAQLNMRLYEMNRLKSDFLANMSHELRTPLNSIIGFSEVLQGVESLTEKQKRYARNIQKSGRVLLEMINDILDLAKLEAGKMEVRPSEFRIDAVLMAQCDMVRALTEEKNIDLEVHVPADIPPLHQDQGKVQQILTNLLSNAIKFTPEGGRITVAAACNGSEQLELTVADTGVGIPEEDREIIFEKFRQSRSVAGTDGLTREYSGTGLGLSIVKELSKQLGGEVSFESELGRGSVFKVTLPWRLPDRSQFNAEGNAA
jgi:signal transduction histidine kinase